MRLKILHDTLYEYETPAQSIIQILRLTPRGHDSQFIRKWRIEIDAECRLDRSEDAFGNILHMFSVEEPISTLRVSVIGDVETNEAAGIVQGAFERLPPTFWLRETPLTRADSAIAEFARDIAGGEGGMPLETLHALNSALYNEVSFSPGNTNAQTTATEAFAARHGVCQDLAHIFVAAARTLNYPARYVGGYYLRTDMTQQEAGHAWAEAYVEHIGWIGFDPAHGVCVTDRHVRVAVGQDYLDASPVRGSRTGGISEKLTVKVDVSQGTVILEG